MLSHQSQKPFLGRHQRQHSTPTVSDAQTTLHRRGLSLDQTGQTQQYHGLPSLDEDHASIEYLLGQQLTQTATTREAQQQPMARPGPNEETMQRLIEKNALRAKETATRPERETYPFENDHYTTPTAEYVHEMQHLPRPARDTGAFSDNYHTTLMTELENDTHHSQRPARSIGMFCNNYHNIEMTNFEEDDQHLLQNTYENINLVQLVQPPCTPPSQTRTSQYMLS